MTVELRSRQAAAGIHAAVAQVEPRVLPMRRRFIGKRGLMAIVLAISTPPAGVALVNAIRGDDPQTNQRIVDDAQRIDDNDDRVPPRERHEDRRRTRGSRPRGAPTTDVQTGGPDRAPATSRAAASLGLSGRLAFTTMEKPVDHWLNNCAGTPCFYYNPSDIHTLDLRSGRTAPLVASPLFEQGSRWSPDGSRLAYSVARGNTTAALHTIRADGSDDRQIVSVEGKFALQPTWSPDGRRIAFALQQHAYPGMTCCPEIWIVDADGSDLHRVDEITNTDGSPWNPAWSPNGRYLAFARWGSDGVAQTWVLDFETGQLEHFTNGFEPAWSPDGKRMAVAVDGVRSANAGAPKDGLVRVFDVASGEEIDVFGRAGQHFAEPAWSPDGRWIAFTSQASTTRSNRSIWVSRLEGKSMTEIVDGGKDYWAPSWVR